MMQRRNFPLLPPVALTASLAVSLSASLLIWLTSVSAARGVEPLPVLARVGPWPVISQFAAYRGKLWFANSVKGVNHNSADLYTYDPNSGQVRYERHLFSQDAGDPMVAGGLLYWPFEDSRFSLGWGHFMVTNGRRWRLGTIPTARIFHTHAMTRQGQRLVAATSAWRGGVQQSRDGGVSWDAVYDHPTQSGRVSRIVSLASLGDTVIGYIKERRDGKNLRGLLRLRGNLVSEVPGWPRNRPVAAMVAHGGALYAAVVLARGTAIWRTDGTRSEAVAPPRPGWSVRGMAAGAGGLWAVSTGETSGRVWFSRDGAAWELRHRLAGGRPQQIALYAGKPYVGGAGADGRGILWGPPRTVPLKAVPLDAVPLKAVPHYVSNDVPGDVPGLPPLAKPAALVNWRKAAEELKQAIGNVGRGDARGGSLRDLVYRYALAGPPAELFSGLLAQANPRGELFLFGGKARVQRVTYVRWILLWGMGLSGQGRVPQALISEPWRTPPNTPEKYFQSPPAAMWAAAMVKQDDRATIAALVQRLGRRDEPMWVKGDAVGALTVLTGQRFAYRFKAWRKWWRVAEPGWRR